ncbi:MAG: hypothetical protein O3B09_01275 [Proteobacteria bacterium]|nr:hypothetical protein [Pseudomonadota bacterium]
MKNLVISLYLISIFISPSLSFSNDNIVDASVTHQSVNGVFVEKFGGGKYNRYITKNLNINNLGKNILVEEGGSFKMSLEIFHSCPECRGAINQIIVGLAGEDKAQKCIWIGGQSSNGWQTVNFRLNIPNQKGVYYIRTRYAQAYNCQDALSWWKVDRPNGPKEESNIGRIRIIGSKISDTKVANINNKTIKVIANEEKLLKKIRKKITTKEEVIKMLGNPNDIRYITEPTQHNREIWIYKKRIPDIVPCKEERIEVILQEQMLFNKEKNYFETSTNRHRVYDINRVSFADCHKCKSCLDNKSKQ